MLAQLLAGVGDVPGLQIIDRKVLGGKAAQFVQFLLCTGLRAYRQVLEEVHHGLG